MSATAKIITKVNITKANNTKINQKTILVDKSIKTIIKFPLDAITLGDHCKIENHP
jgi:hypothetical protein